MIYKTSIIKFFVIVVPVFLIVLVFPSCDDPIPLPETGALLVMLQTSADNTFDSMVLKTYKVEVLWSPTLNGEVQKIVCDTHVRTFNILAMDYDGPFAQYEVPVGYVHQIRYHPQSVQVSYLGNAYTAFLPSGEQTGWKIVDENKEAYKINVNDTTTIKINFNFPERIIKTNGKNKFIVHPTAPSVFVHPEDMDPIVPNKLIWKVSRETPYSEVKSICDTQRVTIINKIEDFGIYELRLPASFPLNDAYDYFNSLPVSASATYSLIAQGGAIPNDPSTDYVCQQTINLINAWDDVTGDYNVVIGIIDSGIQMDHPDLLYNIWINQGELPSTLVYNDVDNDGIITFYDLNSPSNSGLNIPDINSNLLVDAHDILNDSRFINEIDDDGSGFIDDFFGWDFVENDNNPGDDLTLAGMQIDSHGTTVASVAAALTNNGIGAAGTIWKTSVMNIRVTDTNNHGETATIDLGAAYAAYMNSDVTNISIVSCLQRKKQTHPDIFNIKNFDGILWGDRINGRSEFFEDLFKDMESTNKKTLFVVSSGNEDADLNDSDTFGWYSEAMYNGMVSHNDCRNRVIVVGGCTRNGLNRWDEYPADPDGKGSSYGDCVKIYSPGDDVYFITFANPSGWFNTGYSGGTSYSAPFVSGSVALIYSIYNRKYQGDRHSAYQFILNSSANRSYGNLLDVKAAIDLTTP